MSMATMVGGEVEISRVDDDRCRREIGVHSRLSLLGIKTGEVGQLRLPATRLCVHVWVRDLPYTTRVPP